MQKAHLFPSIGWYIYIYINITQFPKKTHFFPLRLSFSDIPYNLTSENRRILTSIDKSNSNFNKTIWIYHRYVTNLIFLSKDITSSSLCSQCFLEIDDTTKPNFFLKYKANLIMMGFQNSRSFLLLMFMLFLKLTIPT